MLELYRIHRGFGFTRRAALGNTLIGCEMYPPMKGWTQEFETVFHIAAWAAFMIARCVVCLMFVSRKASS